MPTAIPPAALQPISYCYGRFLFLRLDRLPPELQSVVTVNTYIPVLVSSSPGLRLRPGTVGRVVRSSDIFFSFAENCCTIWQWRPGIRTPLALDPEIDNDGTEIKSNRSINLSVCYCNWDDDVLDPAVDWRINITSNYPTPCPSSTRPSWCCIAAKESNAQAFLIIVIQHTRWRQFYTHRACDGIHNSANATTSISHTRCRLVFVSLSYRSSVSPSVGNLHGAGHCRNRYDYDDDDDERSVLVYYMCVFWLVCFSFHF